MERRGHSHTLSPKKPHLQRERRECGPRPAASLCPSAELTQTFGPKGKLLFIVERVFVVFGFLHVALIIEDPPFGARFWSGTRSQPRHYLNLSQDFALDGGLFAVYGQTDGADVGDASVSRFLSIVFSDDLF